MKCFLFSLAFESLIYFYPMICALASSGGLPWYCDLMSGYRAMKRNPEVFQCDRSAVSESTRLQSVTQGFLKQINLISEFNFS